MAVKLGEGFVEAVLKKDKAIRELRQFEGIVRASFRRMNQAAQVNMRGTGRLPRVPGVPGAASASGTSAAGQQLLATGSAAGFTASGAAIAGAMGGVAAAAVLKLMQMFERLKQMVVSFVQALVSGMIQSSAQLEQFRLSLGVLLKDQGKANTMIKDIQEFAAKTPFNTSNLLEAVQTLKQFGFETEKILPMLRSIGDAAAASPGGMDFAVGRISLVLGQMKSANRLLGQDVLQLTSAGVPIHAILKEQFGVGLEGVQDLMKKGKVDIDKVIQEILAGMDKRFGGMMAKLATTWAGLMSTLEDNWEIFLQNIGGPLFNRVKGVLQEFVNFLESPAFAEFQSNLADGMEAALRTTEQMVERWKEMVALAERWKFLLSPGGAATAEAVEEKPSAALSLISAPLGLLTKLLGGAVQKEAAQIAEERNSINRGKAFQDIQTAKTLEELLAFRKRFFETFPDEVLHKRPPGDRMSILQGAEEFSKRRDQLMNATQIERGVSQLSESIGEMFADVSKQVLEIPKNIAKQGIEELVKRRKEAAKKFLEGLGIGEAAKKREFNEERLRVEEDRAIGFARELGFPPELIRQMVAERRAMRAGGNPLQREIVEAMNQQQQQPRGGQFMGLVEFSRMIQGRLSGQDPVVKAVDRNKAAVDEVKAAVIQQTVAIGLLGLR